MIRFAFFFGMVLGTLVGFIYSLICNFLSGHDMKCALFFVSIGIIAITVAILAAMGSLK